MRRWWLLSLLGSAKAGAPRVWTVFCAECTNNFDYKSIGVFYSHRLSGMPGGVTRLVRLVPPTHSHLRTHACDPRPPLASTPSLARAHALAPTPSHAKPPRRDRDCPATASARATRSSRPCTRAVWSRAEAPRLRPDGEHRQDACHAEPP